jgi:ATP-binding cassette subfamily C protein CydD
VQVGLGELLAERGLDWPLSERGSGLSGGQLSRLALARLLLRDRPLWLLDEPTAHLDPDSRRQIHQLLQQLARGRSLILVSHSSTGLDWVDQRLELTASTVAEVPNATA